MKNKINRFFILTTGIISLLLFISCVTLIPPASATSSGPRTIVVSDISFNAEEAGGFTSWICADYPDGNKILLEVGIFGDPAYDGVGFILFDGGYSGELTHYKRAGLEHRWDWGPNGNDYAFVVKPDGTGLYYRFTTSDSTKASSVYKCYQRKTPVTDK